jgi:AcrR family transcriptional regulator
MLPVEIGGDGSAPAGTLTRKLRSCLRFSVTVACMRWDPGAGASAIDGAVRPLRKDAERNRQRILDAASQVFAERGLDATLDDIADHAGLGVGTVYRRFPNKEALVETLFEQRVEQMVALAEQATAEQEPWPAFAAFLRRAAFLHAEDRGLQQAMLSGGYGHKRVAAARARLLPAIVGLIERAQAEGTLRPDFRPTDIPIILKMISCVVHYTSGVNHDAWRRYLELLIDSLHAVEGRPPLPVDALTVEEATRAMQRCPPAHC